MTAPEFEEVTIWADAGLGKIRVYFADVVCQASLRLFLGNEVPKSPGQILPQFWPFWLVGHTMNLLTPTYGECTNVMGEPTC